MNKKELEFILNKGEDYNIEFKENVNGIDKDIVAFANAEGGQILIGISDNKIIKGIYINNRIKGEILNIARNCDPEIKIEILSSNNILIVNVFESHNKPHRCSSGVYLRVGAISQKLNIDELRELFNKHGKLFYEEMINSKFTIRDFDKKKFHDFLKLAKISRSFKDIDILKNLGLIDTNNYFKNSAILLFGKSPSKFIPQGIITCVLYKGNDKVYIIDKKDFTSDIISNYNDAISFLYKHLKLRYEISGFGPRKEILEIPEDALKEAVINAICHRDYAEKGAVIQIDIFDNRVEISNPGGLIIKESDFGKKSLSRNPLIFGLLQRINLVEHVGSGILRIRSTLKTAKLKPPKFEFGIFFTIIFDRENYKINTHKEVPENVPDNVPENVSKNRIKKILDLIKANKKISSIELSKTLEVTDKTIKRDLKKLKSKKIIKRIGPDKGGYWIERKLENAPKNVPEDVPLNVPENRIEKLISLIKANKKISSIELSKNLKAADKTIKRDLKKLKQFGLLKRIGSPKGGYWKIIRKKGETI
ncbi:MAG: ATP-binding protein [archaeon]